MAELSRLAASPLSYAKGTTPIFGASYAYGTSAHNDGLISGITDNVDNGRSVAYSYDALARLSAATTTGSSGYPAWGLQWTYDRYGNRTAQSIASGCSGVSCPTNSVTVSASTNQITTSGYSYDLNGNMTNDGYNTLTYDAENHLLTAGNSLSSGAYAYDGNGLRIEKCVPNCSSPTTTTVYIFSGSKVVAEYDNGAAVGSPSREYIYSSSQLIATLTSAAAVYHHPDNLSIRATSDSSGNKVGEQGHFPFGEAWYAANTTTKWQFTTYERDSESGNDFAMARYHLNRLGRFSSPDPLLGTTGNPQSLNRYSYGWNLPVNLRDPSGRSPVNCQTMVQNRGNSTSTNGVVTGPSGDEAETSDSSDGQPSYCGDSGGGGGGGDDCVYDGAPGPCSLLGDGGLAGNESTVQCPNNVCTHLWINNIGMTPVYFLATTNGSGAFYTYSGAGSFNFATTSRDAAGVNSINNSFATLGKQPKEYSGDIYLDGNGLYSFTAPVMGAPCTIDTKCISYFAPPPPGVQLEGIYHTHPFGGPFSTFDTNTADNHNVTTYMGNPQGCIVYYVGNSNPPVGGILQGAPSICP